MPPSLTEQLYKFYDSSDMRKSSASRRVELIRETTREQADTSSIITDPRPARYKSARSIRPILFSNHIPDHPPPKEAEKLPTVSGNVETFLIRRAKGIEASKKFNRDESDVSPFPRMRVLLATLPRAKQNKSITTTTGNFTSYQERKEDVPKMEPTGRQALKMSCIRAESVYSQNLHKHPINVIRAKGDWE